MSDQKALLVKFMQAYKCIPAHARNSEIVSVVDGVQFTFQDIYDALMHKHKAEVALQKMEMLGII